MNTERQTDECITLTPEEAGRNVRAGDHGAMRNALTHCDGNNRVLLEAAAAALLQENRAAIDETLAAFPENTRAILRETVLGMYEGSHH